VNGVLDKLLLLFVVSVLTEGIWENLKKVIPQVGFIKKHWNYIGKIGALLVGVAVAWLTDINIFALLEINIRSHIIGVILTGVMLGRGSNYVHDIISKLNKSTVENNKPDPDFSE